MRELMRSVARANMRALGREQLNKKRINPEKTDQRTKKTSYFAKHWREYIHRSALYKQAARTP